MKRIIALLLALSMFACLLTACGGQDGTDTTASTTDGSTADATADATADLSVDSTADSTADSTTDSTADSTAAASDGYTVTVTDAFGNPYTSGVIVRFLQGGKQVSMQVIDANGTVNKDLTDGEYTVELKFTGKNSYYYDTSDLTLNKNKKSLNITLYNAASDDSEPLFATTLKSDSKRDMPSYQIGVGATYLELVAGERNYYQFTPTESGLYHISVIDSDAVPGYYGSPYAVRDTTGSPLENGYIEINFKQSMIGNVLVLGLDATGKSTTAVLAIERVGNAVLGDEDVPYEAYKPATTPTAFTLPAGTQTAEFDLMAKTNTYNIVLGDDGYYHMDTKNGPLVLVRLGENATGSYLDPLEIQATKSIVGKYFYGDDGKLIKKESYNQCLQDYAACADEETGLYPLTEDLKYIIQQRGDHAGWFDSTNPGYLFVNANGEKVPGINAELGWLVLCCYVKA